MNERSRFPLAFAWLASLALAACSPAGGSEPPLQGARIGGPFTLTDQNGARFDSRSLQGRYRIVYFGYTFCPDVCPVDLQQIGLAMTRLEASDPELARRVQPIFITTDPERDTPAVLKEFVAAFHPRLVGLTGTPQEIAAVSKAHAVYGMKQETKGASGYLVNHSRMALLFGPKGEPIAILPHEEGADAILAELKKWVA
jgi:protein SCO1/2